MLLFREETLSCFCLPGREDAEQSSSKRDFFVSWSRKLVRWIFLSFFFLLPFFFIFFLFVSFSLIVFHFYYFFFYSFPLLFFTLRET